MPHIPPQSYLDVSNEAEATFYFSEWLGAMFYYFLGKRSQPFDMFIRNDYTIRNVITGWLLQLGIILFLIILLSLLMKS